jgi:hypothetical protein
MILQGGSLLPFVIRHGDDWLWNTPVVQHANNAARDITKPLIISKQVLIFD